MPKMAFYPVYPTESVFVFDTRISIILRNFLSYSKNIKLRNCGRHCNT